MGRAGDFDCGRSQTVGPGEALGELPGTAVKNEAQSSEANEARWVNILAVKAERETDRALLDLVEPYHSGREQVGRTRGRHC